MSKLATFTPDVARAIFDFTKANPRNAKAELAESVWGFGFTKDSPRKFFSQKEWAGRCHPLGWLRNAHENTLGTLFGFL